MNDIAAQADVIADALQNHGWLALPDFLSPSMCAALFNDCQQRRDQFAAALIGRGDARQFAYEQRRDETLWLCDDSAVQHEYLGMMDLLRAEINRRLFLGLHDYEAHYAHYAPGTFYRRHRDAFAQAVNVVQAPQRVLTSVIYLNDAEGGELIIYNDERELHRVVPRAYRRIFFKHGISARSIACMQRSFQYRRMVSRAMTMHENPLLPLVLQLLRETPAGISEYELLKKIEARGNFFSELASESQLALFQKHFLVMNALYRLQNILWQEENIWLSIAPLRIALETIASDAIAVNMTEYVNDALRTYYLDWQQFIAADSESVNDLLASFWSRYAALDRRSEALATLQLEVGASWDEIKIQYRRLAAATHPDRGGDAAQFLAIRAAYEMLREY